MTTQKSTTTIVVGVDGSDHSERAVAWCADHAKALDAQVVAVYAMEPAFYGGYSGLVAMSLPIAMTADQRLAIKEVVTENWCKALASAGVSFLVRVEDGSPSATLIRVASEVDANLVVTGRRGHGGFAELLLGSTTHQLSHHLNRPHVIVP